MLVCYGPCLNCRVAARLVLCAVLQVAAAVEALAERGVFDRVSGGFPANFHSVRGALEVLDSTFTNSPLKGSIKRRADLQARGGGEEVRQGIQDGPDKDPEEHGKEKVDDDETQEEEDKKEPQSKARRLE